MSLEGAFREALPQRQRIVDVDEAHFMRKIEELKFQGANALATRWINEYDETDPLDSKKFFERFDTFLKKREDALFSLDIPPGLDDRLVEEIKQFDKNITLSFGNASLFQGNGATAETYQIMGHPGICVKFITNQSRYNENNHMRLEFALLDKVRNIKVGRVRAPSGYFLRIHPRDGHSFGMEKVQGKTLSQITEKPGEYAELVAVAKGLDVDSVVADLRAFVERMHKEGGITHNDLFDRNLMLDRDGTVFVIDFGKAAQYESNAPMRDIEEQRDLAVAENSVRSFFAKIDNL